MRFLVSSATIAVLLAAALVLAAPAGVSAQGAGAADGTGVAAGPEAAGPEAAGPEAAGPEAAGPEAKVPEAAVISALAGSRDGILALNRFLTGGGVPPAEVTRRATALIKALGERRQDVEAEKLLRAVDRVMSLAGRALASARILKLGVEPGFTPAKGSIAWDFGPPDAKVAPGFERVVPNDPRLRGRKVGGLRRPQDQDLLSDGVSGVERIEVKVANGPYRVILMTQNLSDPALAENPFGRRIKVNGVPVLVPVPDPDKWTPEAYLSDRGVALVGSTGRRAKGFLTGDIGGAGRRITLRQQGGALVLEARATEGRIVIELSGFGRSRSYLTGLVVEPASRLSDLVLSPEAAKVLIPLDRRIALEAEILAAAAVTMEEVAPGAGSPRIGELPEPEFETAEVVSES